MKKYSKSEIMEIIEIIWDNFDELSDIYDCTEFWDIALKIEELDDLIKK